LGLRLGTSVRVLPLPGKPSATDFQLTDPLSDRTAYATAPKAGSVFVGTYRGIHGTLFLDGPPGGADARWVFTPTLDADAGWLGSGHPERFRYTRNSDGTHTAVPSVDYGLWLDLEPALDLHLRAGVVGTKDSEANADVHTAADTTTGLAAIATYTGTAAGLSARPTNAGPAAGTFMADVEMTARFGPLAGDPLPEGAPTPIGALGGRITHFRSTSPGPAHVNPAWAVELTPPPDNPDGATFDRGGALVGGDFTGRWSGVGWTAEPNTRPDGFYGGFRVDFPDGVAAGLYSVTR